MVLLVLAVLWGIVLIPPALRARSERRRVRSVETFQRRLAVLAPAGALAAARPTVAARPSGASRPPLAVVASPAPAVTPSSRPALPERRVPRSPHPVRDAGATRPSRAAILRRRRLVLAVLLVAMAATLASGAALGLRLLWAVHLAIDLGLVAYVAGLLRLRRLALERAAKVRYLPAPASAPGAPSPVAAPEPVADGRLRQSASS